MDATAAEICLGWGAAVAGCRGYGELPGVGGTDGHRDKRERDSHEVQCGGRGGAACPHEHCADTSAEVYVSGLPAGRRPRTSRCCTRDPRHPHDTLKGVLVPSAELWTLRQAKEGALLQCMGMPAFTNSPDEAA
jgi:hypothetical protein